MAPRLARELRDEVDLDESVLVVADTVNVVRVKVKKVGGGYLELDWDERNFKETYRD